MRTKLRGKSQNEPQEEKKNGEMGKTLTKTIRQTLTLALLDVGVDLMQGAHGDLSDLCIEQKLHQGGGDVFAGGHAGRLCDFTLKERETQEEGSVLCILFLHGP